MEEGVPRLTSYGVKIISYRHVAEAAVDELADHIPALSGKHWTAKAPLPGGDFPVTGAAALRAEYKLAHPFMSAATVDHLARPFGPHARRRLAGPDQRAPHGGESAHWRDRTESSRAQEGS